MVTQVFHICDSAVLMKIKVTLTIANCHKAWVMLCTAT